MLDFLYLFQAFSMIFMLKKSFLYNFLKINHV